MSSIGEASTAAVTTGGTIDAMTGVITDDREGIAHGRQFAAASGDMADGIGDAGASVFGATGRKALQKSPGFGRDFIDLFQRRPLLNL